MELYKPKLIDRKTIALTKIHKAIKSLEPIVSNLGFSDEKMNLLQVSSKLPKIIKGIKQNEAVLKEVFNKEFLIELEELTNENT